ncbi:unnamed protein product [Rhizoctonia solani]|uniref:Uncharacterized protein n=1 Tax=Rhizoctonia solani TaxID=456999 RepID=A0A8H3BB10_9AGAM|nr:unnamed protein product [Rhizoctonia solani]
MVFPTLPPTRHILTPGIAKQLAENLAGTNYKLVPVKDSEEAGPGPESSNKAMLQPTPDQKAPPKGFHVGDVLGLTREEYQLLLDIVKLTLKEASGINIHCTIREQRKGVVNDAICMIVKKDPEFEVYKPDGYWPCKDFIYVALKSLKEAFLRRSNSAKLARELVNATDAWTQNNTLVKKRQLARARGQASAKARAQARNRLQVQADTAPKAEDLIEDNKGNWNAPELLASGTSDDAVEAIAHDISLMSLCLLANGELHTSSRTYTNQNVLLTDTTMTEEDNFEGPMLPTCLSNPPPSTQKLVSSSSVAPEASPPAFGPSVTPASPDPGLTAIQGKLARLRGLSPDDRLQLPLGLQLLLDMLDANSELPKLELLKNLLDTFSDTASPSQALPEPPETAYTSTPVATNLPTSKNPTATLGTSFLTISELEPGPTTLQVDDSDDDSLSDISVSNSNQRNQPKQAQTSRKAIGTSVSTSAGAKDTGSEPPNGQAQGRGGRGGGRGAGRGAAKKSNMVPQTGDEDNACGRGCGQPSPSDDSTPVTIPTPSTGRTTRSRSMKLT